MSRTPDVLLRDAQSLAREGRLPEAIEAYQQLLALRADLPDAWYNLAVLFRATGRHSAALECYQHALNRGVAQPEDVHLNRGVIYSDHLHRYDAAERELQMALTLNPKFVPALLNLANLQEDQGRAREAACTYEKILQLHPSDSNALARYAGLQDFQSTDEPFISRLRAAFTAPGATDADRATLGFALGRALDSCGAYAAAFETYAASNQFSRKSAAPGTGHYDKSATEQFIDELIAAFPGRSTPSAQRASGPRPIFICGMFRSGSTLIEQLIADRTGATAGGELGFLPDMACTALAPFPTSMATRSPGQLQLLAGQYLQSLARVFPDATHVTDKRPDNFLLIGLIKQLFPDARIVHTRRNPLDNCLSIFFLHLDQRMRYALDLADTGHYYVQYLRLMQHWKALYGADIHDVDYDAYVHNPEAVTGQLLDFLGVASQPAANPPGAQPRAVKTASVWQVRQPLYQRSSGRASHYAGELAPLRAYLETGQLR